MAGSSDGGFDPLQQTGQEVVLAADFDRHGTRLVTGSADHRLRVFDLNEKNGEWKLVEAWRGHNADVLDVKFHPLLSRPALLASTGSDLRLKIWIENLHESSRSGRRFRCVYSQSANHAVVYTSIDFVCPPSITSSTNPYSTVLAAITRDGLLSLLEPVESPNGGPEPTLPVASGVAARKTGVPGGLDDWREVDQIWVDNDAVQRGTETAFKVAFLRGDPAGVGAGPSYAAVEAGVDERALTLAVTAMELVKVYRLIGDGPDGEGPYRFDAPIAELTEAQGLVRDVAWAPTAWRLHERLATASKDGFLRLYEIWTPESDKILTSAPAKGRATGTATGKITSGISTGLAGASRASERLIGPGQVLHRWNMVAELRHVDIWKVAWLREGSMLVSTADNGKALIWAQAYDGSWKEFADFGPENPGEPIIRPRN